MIGKPFCITDRAAVDTADGDLEAGEERRRGPRRVGLLSEAEAEGRGPGRGRLAGAVPIRGRRRGRRPPGGARARLPPPRRDDRKQLYEYAIRDGYNQLGTDDGCMVGCSLYSDVTGYAPADWSMRERERWLSLVEDDGRGFFYRQEHVTPHSKSSVSAT